MYAFLFDTPGFFESSADEGDTLPDSVTLLCGDVLTSADNFFASPSSPSSLGFLLGVPGCLGLSPEVSSSTLVLFLALGFLARGVCLSSRSLASCCNFAHSDCLSGFYREIKVWQLF